MPLRSRDVPPIIPSVRHFAANQQEEATVMMSDVYEGLDGIVEGAGVDAC